MTKNKSQSDKFIETAYELGCDESEKTFDEKLKKLIKEKTELQKKKPAK